MEAKKADKDKIESEHQRQRRLRSARRYFNKAKGLDTITFEGDKVTVDEVWNLLIQGEKQLHDADGGRDVARSDHPRTRDQRMYDALHGAVTGGGGGARPSAVISVPVNPNEHPELIGQGPIPDSVARELLGRAGLSVMLINELTGEPLWLSRRARHASAAQFLALVVRDKGCVMCGAHWVLCHAHHRVPFSSPAEGETDIDNLALVCPGCHTGLHQDGLTLVRKPDGTWHTRAALDHELAPQRPDRTPPRSHSGSDSPSAKATAGRGARRTPPGQPVRADNQHNPALFPQPGTGRAGGGPDEAADG